MYGGRSGTFHNGYLWSGHFTLRPGDGVASSSHLLGTYIRPALDKMVKDGEVVSYQLMSPLIHSP